MASVTALVMVMKFRSLQGPFLLQAVQLFYAGTIDVISADLGARHIPRTTCVAEPSDLFYSPGLCHAALSL